jgi:peptide/nickel transport system permease protein
MWRKFRKHKLAMAGAVVTIVIYLVALFAEFLAPFSSGAFSAQYTYAPPQPLHFFVETAESRQFQPHVNGYKVEIDQAALRRTFVVDEEQRIPVGFFVKGAPYKRWGLFRERPPSDWAVGI